MDITREALALLVIAGLTAGLYAKSEDTSSLLAALVAVGTAVAIYLLTK